jgi:hypothetical protein
MAAKRKRRKSRGLKGSTASCAGTKGKGRLKKGFKWKRGHKCPVPAKKS